MESIPESIGKYRIKRVLGEGAMGIVYEGIDSAIDRRVAIKTLHSHLLTKRDGKEFLERFIREARSAARCTHPNIVTVLEYGEGEDFPFIAMEYIDGLSLQQIIQSKKKITLNITLSIVSQLLKAINAAHNLGVVHRDIKTANIMLSKESNTVKLADFGIARIADNQSMTLTGAVVGTPRYMAPEQMFGLKVDKRADLFSIAMVFTELLATINHDSSIPSSKLPVIEGLPPNNKINYSCLYPDSLIPVIKKGLASKPTERFQNAREFASAIKQALGQLKKGGVNSTKITNTSMPADNDIIIPQDLDSLTNMLSEYVGPVARNVMRNLTPQFASMTGLVAAVSQEISDDKERQSFLSDWEKQSGGRSLSRETSLNSQGGRSQSTRGSSIRLDENTIQKISNDYVNYIGPFAHRMVDHYCNESTDKEEFLKNLASEIPDRNSRDEFVKKWSLS
jgi:serine/threonine-protein kinase